MEDFLTTADVAALLGVQPASIHRYRVRESEQFPEPARMFGRTPVWTQEQIDAWQAARPGRGHRKSN